ncbi:hypothetical protein ACFORL_09250 [Legionella dresdenensis]|uniref:Uncharacterized protein n=1 Tax=Legionella dresdenensis TaxID=450200 RepID=A0ABV8CGA5_9GAMM
MSDLIEDLRNYSNSKGNSEHDREKKDFFNKLIRLLEENQLNVATLTEELSKLTLRQRKNLFYLRRQFGASSTSRAGDFITMIFESLNISLEPLELESVVRSGMSEAKKLNLQWRVYHIWLSDRFNADNIHALERELKYYMGLQPINKVPLASLIQIQLEEQNYQQLEQLLLKANRYAPEYLSEVINKLVIQAPAAMQELIAIARRNPDLTKKIITANAEIAYQAARQDSSLFFHLSAELQRSLLAKAELENNSQFHEELARVKYEEPVLSASEQGYFNRLLIDGGYCREAATQGHEAHKLYKQLNQNIINQVTPAIIAHDQAENAVKLINSYLEKFPGTYKKLFFEQLKTEIIRGNKFDQALLQGHLQRASRERLFAKWSGRDKSRAGELICKLAAEVCAFPNLNDLQKHKILSQGLLPAVNQEGMKQRISRQVENCLHNPALCIASNVGQVVKRVVEFYQSFSRITEYEQARQQLNAEAIYQRYLISKGLQQASEQETLLVDTQGHILTTVKLGQDDINAILTQMTGNEVRHGTLAMIASRLGVSQLTAATVCNLDVSLHPELMARVRQTILGNEPGEQLSIIVDSYLASNQRGSVIALQEEMMMHAQLGLRTLLKKFPEIILTDTQNLQLMHGINCLVLGKFRRILANSRPELNFVYINRELDNCRKELAPLCRELVVETLVSIMDSNQKLQFQDVLVKLESSDFENTTATGLDYLRTDSCNGTVVRIEATEYTAHGKVLGGQKQALRLLARNHYQPQSGQVMPYANSTQEARVPSIAVISVPHSESVHDVTAKLGYSAQQLRQKVPGYRGPIVYNLLTSLHSSAYERLLDNRNRQRESARQILIGAHHYNRAQVRKGMPFELIYVQNIPVNQHTVELNSASLNDANAEAALMVDIALLSTLYHHRYIFPPAMQTSIARCYKNAHWHYVSFLTDAEKREFYFKNSEAGVNTVRLIENYRTSWAVAEFDNLSADFNNLAVLCLLKMFADGSYKKKQFGMLMQTLSVFSEPISQAGCKSANERYQAVAGRVELLKSLSVDPNLTPEKQNVIDAMKGYIAGKSPLDYVQYRLDTAYNLYNLQGAAASFSTEDQGGPSKVQSTKNRNKPGVINEMVNTNYAETGYLTRLQQTNASELQAHKANLHTSYQKLFGNGPAILPGPHK